MHKNDNKNLNKKINKFYFESKGEEGRNKTTAPSESGSCLGFRASLFVSPPATAWDLNFFLVDAEDVGRVFAVGTASERELIF